MGGRGLSLSGHTGSATGIKVTFIFYYLLELQEPTTPLVLGLGKGGGYKTHKIEITNKARKVEAHEIKDSGGMHSIQSILSVQSVQLVQYGEWE